MSSKFEVYKDSKESYRFRLKARNEEIILNSDGYISKTACMNGIKAVKKYSLNASIEELKDR